LVSWIRGKFVQYLRIGWWMGKSCEVKSDRQLVELEFVDV